MEFVKCEKKEAGLGLYGKTKNLDIIEDFIETGYAYAILKDLPYKNAYSATTSLNRSAKYYGYDYIHFVSRKNVVYVVNKHSADFN